MRVFCTVYRFRKQSIKDCDIPTEIGLLKVFGWEGEGVERSWKSVLRHSMYDNAHSVMKHIPTPRKGGGLKGQHRATLSSEAEFMNGQCR